MPSAPVSCCHLQETDKKQALHRPVQNKLLFPLLTMDFECLPLHIIHLLHNKALQMILLGNMENIHNNKERHTLSHKYSYPKYRPLSVHSAWHPSHVSQSLNKSDIQKHNSAD